MGMEWNADNADLHADCRRSLEEEIESAQISAGSAASACYSSINLGYVTSPLLRSSRMTQLCGSLCLPQSAYVDFV